MAAPAAVAEIRPPAVDAVEVLLTLTPGQYEVMGEDIETIRRQLELPVSVSPQTVIIEAVHRQAARK